MKNRAELIERMEVLKVLYKIALRENDLKRMDDLASEIIRLNVITKEDMIAKKELNMKEAY